MEGGEGRRHLIYTAHIRTPRAASQLYPLLFSAHVNTSPGEQWLVPPNRVRTRWLTGTSSRLATRSWGSDELQIAHPGRGR